VTDPDLPSGEPQPSQQIQIQVGDAMKHGTYANFLVVSHTAHEFTLDFCQIIPGHDQTLQAEVVSRVKVAPTMVGKIIRALNTNMTAYEDKFGLVKDVG
jgi:hypothetical protein